MIKLSQYLSNKSVAVLISLLAPSLRWMRERGTVESFLLFAFCIQICHWKSSLVPSIRLYISSTRIAGISSVMKALDLQAVCVWGFLCSSRCYSARLSRMMNQPDDLQVSMLNLCWEVLLLIYSEQKKSISAGIMFCTCSCWEYFIICGARAA